MEPLATTHTRQLHLLCGAFVVTTLIYGFLVLTVPPPEAPVFTQEQALLWLFMAITVLNLVTIMPVYRAMLGKPRQVFAVSNDPLPLLRAHRAAHLVAFARLEAIAVMGLVLFFATGRGDWFWYFNGIALVSMLVLWPLKEKVDALLEITELRGDRTA